MKGLFGVAVLAAVVLLASAHHLELCKKADKPLKDQLKCQRDHATPAFNSKFDSVNKQLQCDSDFCTIRKLCAEPDFETALKKFFTESEIQVLHELANHCDPDSPTGHDHHAHDHHH
ncbi:antimicrobial peptide microplusin-like [Ornithodoros turicata]|uniref:Putative microplusin-like antimicrobial n=1 Tax=Ornithodoros turicata TaxID=34597 RepID=A0A2R5LFG8_9ACAR